MGNAHARPHPRPRNKKQVHWKAADIPSAPGKPKLSNNELTPDLVTVVWSKPGRDGGAPIHGYLVEHRKAGSVHWLRSSASLVGNCEITLNGLDPGWRYQFRVRAENSVGLSDASEISEPLTVTLQKFAVTVPKFTEELADATVLENDKVEFQVHFMGQPSPKICWFKDGFEIFSSRRTRIFTEGERSVLTVHQAALGDEGEIKCTATNKAGHASTKARLILEAPPSIRLPRQYEEGILFEIGELIKLKVSVAGRPKPLVFWTHDGETIKNNERYEIEHVERSSILKVDSATRSDRGEYQIKAVNKVGDDTASFLVTITDKPAPPGRARVVMTLGRSVTLSWGMPPDDGGCKIGNYIIEYYRLGWNVWLKAATSRQLSTILGDLIEGSEYKFRVKAESPYGVSAPSEESDVVFIPDSKRGINTPEQRQDSELILEVTTPKPAKRRNKPPKPERPERIKVKTPELPRKETIIDRESIARDLAYGTPETKLATPKKILERDKSEDDQFMLVLYPTAPQKGKLGYNAIMSKPNPPGSQAHIIDFEDYDEIPPPLSLSAPELGTEPPIFNNLRHFASSSELLHERAMIRLSQEAPSEDPKKFEIPKIQINSEDDSEIVGLHLSSSRRRSSLHPKLWAANKGPITRQRSESEEKEEEVFQQVRSKMGPSAEKRTIEVLDEDKWLEEYEESLSESETESEDERDFDAEPPPVPLTTEDEEIYHPGAISSKPFEILTQRKNPPDASFIPKPILKKPEEPVNPPDIIPVKTRARSPMPEFGPQQQRKFSLTTTQKDIVLEEPKPQFKPGTGMNISAVATLCGITAASIVIPERLLDKKENEEESKVVADHYMDIVRNYAKPARKKSVGQIPDFWKDQTQSGSPSEAPKTSPQKTVEAKLPGSYLGSKSPEVPLERKPVEAKLPVSYLGSKAADVPPMPAWEKKAEEAKPPASNMVSKPPISVRKTPPKLTPSPPKTKEKSTSPIPKRRRSSAASQSSRSPLKADTPKSRGNSPHLENWSDTRRRSPSLTLSPRPKLREMPTQTSIGLELNYSRACQTERLQLFENTERKVRSYVDYVTDLTMFGLACWFYLFSNELLAIPVLLIMVYRQLKDEIKRRIPRFMMKKK